MSYACFQHRDAVFVCHFDRILVLDAAAWLNDCFDAVFGSILYAVVHREEGITRQYSAFDGVGRFGLLDGNFDGSDTVHLACADADCLFAVCQYDGVALHVFNDFPGEIHCFHFVFSRLTFGHDFPISRYVFCVDVLRLFQHAAQYGDEFFSACFCSREIQSHDADIFLLGQNG
ncbi:hypothetical protein SDC9_115532 [bioreactor metagenome]|uniref:Uncharacterized protein n=1 Tax=bioreactor metagenome TaxID=1076179 RepID=A0A645BU49_9ZZZZ